MRSGVRGHGAIGARQVALLRTVHGGRWFDCVGSNSSYRACMRLESRGLLARDPMDIGRFTSTAAGDALIESHDDELSRAAGAAA